MAQTDYKPGGFLGGWVYAEGERREKQTHARDIQAKDLEIQQKSMELQDYEYKRKQREAESDVAVQRAEREKMLAPRLDKEASMKVDASILGLETAMDIQQLENVATQIGEIKDEQTFNYVMDNMSPAEKRKWGLDKVKSYAEALPIMKYIGGRAAHSMDQIRALELTGLKGSYSVASSKAASVGWTPEGPSMPLGPDQQAAVMQSVVKDEDFHDLYDVGFGVAGDPTTSDDVVLASSMAAEEARQLLTENEAARRADKTGRARSLGWAEAIDIAKERTKAFLFKDVGKTLSGAPRLELYSPQDAATEYNKWKSQNWNVALTNPQFRGLSAERQDRYMKLAYIQQRLADLQVAKAKMYNDISSRTE